MEIQPSYCKSPDASGSLFAPVYMFDINTRSSCKTEIVVSSIIVGLPAFSSSIIRGEFSALSLKQHVCGALTLQPEASVGVLQLRTRVIGLDVQVVFVTPNVAGLRNIRINLERQGFA